MSDLARSLIDAAAEAVQDSATAVHPDTASVEGNADRMGTAAVVAVLETLAEQGKSTDPDIPPQLRLAVPAMQRLSSELREGR